jgi:hypothetical protein
MICKDEQSFGLTRRPRGNLEVEPRHDPDDVRHDRAEVASYASEIRSHDQYITGHPKSSCRRNHRCPVRGYFPRLPGTRISPSPAHVHSDRWGLWHFGASTRARARETCRRPVLNNPSTGFWHTVAKGAPDEVQRRSMSYRPSDNQPVVRTLVPFDGEERISVKEAAAIARKSERTIRNWGVVHGIARRVGGGPWMVSLVGYPE